MYYLLGKKESFAIEIEETTVPQEWKSTDLWIKSAIWINNTRIGDWEDANIIGPLVGAMFRISTKYDTFWLEELEDLTCYNLYLTIHPNYNDPSNFFNLTEEEQDKLIPFGKFLLSWGENFDSWGLCMVYKKGVCKFLWVHTPLGNDESYEVKNNIQCFDIKLEYVQQVYEELIKAIPNEHWPRLIPK